MLAVRREVEQFEAVRRDVAGDLRHVLADAAYGAVGRRLTGRAAPGPEVDQTADGVSGLLLGGASLRNFGNGRELGPAAAAQAAPNGRPVHAHAARREPALQLGDGGARVVQGEQFVLVAVEAGGSAEVGTPRSGVGLQARHLGGGGVRAACAAGGTRRFVIGQATWADCRLRWGSRGSAWMDLKPCTGVKWNKVLVYH